MTMPTEASTVTLAPAGFWRRLAAFVVDSLFLGVLGMLLGAVLAPTLAALGAWGRLLGFVIAGIYFGALNSRLGGGQTLGKRVAGIKVVDGGGAALSLPRALLRFIPLGLPWFLNNATLPQAALVNPWLSVLTVLIFGLALSQAYLMVFNRPARQAVHDLLVGSWVVRAGTGERVETSDPRPVHLVVPGLLVTAAAVAPFLMQGLAGAAPFAALMKAQQAVSAEPWVNHAQVSAGTSFMAQTGTGQQQMTYLSVQAFVRSGDIQDAARAQTVARLAMAADPAFGVVDAVQIRLVLGYDIGIASFWRSQTYTHTPAEWLK